MIFLLIYCLELAILHGISFLIRPHVGRSGEWCWWARGGGSCCWLVEPGVSFDTFSGTACKS